MSQQNVKGATKPTESSAKKIKKASGKPSAAIEQVLLDAELITATIGDLVVSKHQARKKKHTPAQIRELAESIAGVGLVQNLVGHRYADNDSLGVCVGGGRTSAIELLLSEGRWEPERIIHIRIVPEKYAKAVSLTENGKRFDMHPHDQVTGFRSMADDGQSAAQIGDLMGYSTRHVERCLRLSDLAPSILDDLAADKLTLDMCQALTLTDSHERQVAVWATLSRRYNPDAADIRCMLTENEVRTSNEPKFNFIGQEAYEAAGGTLRADLFSDAGEGYVDPVLVDSLTLEKLTQMADEIRQKEGWAWSEGRLSVLYSWSDEGKAYVIPANPSEEYTDAEATRVTALDAQILATDDEALQQRLQAEIDAIDEAVEQRAWSHVSRENAGVSVAFCRGEMTIQRGLVRRSDLPKEPGQEATVVSDTDSVSAALVKSMSCERTLAVQAALTAMPEVSVALLTWHLCRSVFVMQRGKDPLKITLHSNQAELAKWAASGEEGKAWLFLMEQKASWEARLPDDWHMDFTWLLAWSAQDVNALLGFCSALAVDGIQERFCGRTGNSGLDQLETAMKFDLREWWQPDAKGFFKRISGKQIAECLADAGEHDRAREAAGMAKKDAAALAEEVIGATRWVPGWMQPENRGQADSSDSASVSLDAAA